MTKPTVSVAEPAPFRRQLVKCPRCSSFVPESMPEGRHGVHYANREGSMVLIDCAGAEVAP